MLVISERGFYNAVVHKDDPDRIMVRTRVRTDLESLRECMPGASEIIGTPDADYPYRTVVSRDSWEAAVNQMAHEMDYTSFYEANVSRHGHERAGITKAASRELARLTMLEAQPAGVTSGPQLQPTDRADVRMTEDEAYAELASMYVEGTLNKADFGLEGVWLAVAWRRGASEEDAEAQVTFEAHRRWASGLHTRDLYTDTERMEHAEQGLFPYIVTTDWGRRLWWAEDEQHARDQHYLAFPNDPQEKIIGAEARE